MSPFLEGVRIIDVHAPMRIVASSKPGASPSDEDAEAVIGTPTPSPPPPRSHHGESSDIPVFAVPITAIVCTFIYLTIKTIMAPFRDRSQRKRGDNPGYASNPGGLTSEEVAVLQKIQRTLTQMETRVEALETIIIEQSRSEKPYGSKF